MTKESIAYMNTSLVTPESELATSQLTQASAGHLESQRFSHISFIGYWPGYVAEYTSFFCGIKWKALPVNLLSVQVFGKRACMEDQCMRFPSHYRQFFGPQAYRSLPHGFDTYSVLVTNENQFVNVYLRNSFDHYADYVDLAMGAQDPEQISTTFNNYLKFPCYITSIFKLYGIPTLAELKKFVADIETKRQANPFFRDYISCLIASHNSVHNFKGVREQLIHIIEKAYPQQPVFCLGRYRHNSDLLRTEYNDNKLACLSRFIFNLCPENTWTPGYVTEKIIDSLLAGCIPVYWGGIESEADIFNMKAIVYYNPRRPQELVAQFESFNDENKIAEFLTQPVFHPGAAQRLFCRYIAPLLARLQIDLGIDSSVLREFNPEPQLPAGYNWQDDYLLAQQELQQLGLEETTYEYLINQDKYSWPFLHIDKLKVRQQDYLLHKYAPSPVTLIYPYHNIAKDIS